MTLAVTTVLTDWQEHLHRELLVAVTRLTAQRRRIVRLFAQADARPPAHDAQHV